jgi:hypothetical protein
LSPGPRGTVGFPMGLSTRPLISVVMTHYETNIGRIST